MKKFFSWLWIEFSNHNRYKVIALIFCSAFLLFCHSCEPKCDSLLSPGQKITFEELQNEVDIFCGRAAHEANNIAKQQEMRAYLWNVGMQTAATGTFNWLNFLLGAGAFLGVGAGIDNVRYRLKFPQSK